MPIQRFSLLLGLLLITAKLATASEYETIEWVDLIPEDDLAALLSPPDLFEDIPDGSAQDRLDLAPDELADKALSEQERRYFKALQSQRVISEYDQRQIRLPGFIVPLEFDDNQVITTFFLVPYFGACLHFPPPPPNQIVYVEYPKGLTLDELTTPFWVMGRLTIDMVSNQTATAAYRMTVDKLEEYTEE